MTTRTPTRARTWIGVVGLLVALLVAVGVGVYRSDVGRAQPAPAAAQGGADLADLSSDSYQQDLATQITADISQLTANPGQADHNAEITSACQLVAQVTLPLPGDEDRWVSANCVDPDQDAHPGAYVGKGGVQ
jgi:hypothetical protein